MIGNSCNEVLTACIYMQSRVTLNFSCGSVYPYINQRAPICLCMVVKRVG